jgi:hypothetical protein
MTIQQLAGEFKGAGAPSAKSSCPGGSFHAETGRSPAKAVETLCVEAA